MAGRMGSSIGLAPPPGYRLVREEAPLPPSRELRLLEIQTILERGVQRLVVEVGKPIIFYRIVKADDADLDEIVEEDLFVQARNNEMLEFPLDGDAPESSVLTVFQAFRELRKRGISPLAFLYFDSQAVSRWLFKKTVDVSDIYGVRAIRHGEVPEGVLLLLGSTPGENDVVLTLRISLQEGGFK